MLTEEQRIFLESDGLVTLKACPGSGKTFVVAKKIKKILSSWNQFHCGVAALSFTNVASEEILQRINNGQPLAYPHFAGTLDSFLNEFIALPFGYLAFEQPQRPTIDVGFSRDLKIYWRHTCRQRCCTHLNDFHYEWKNKCLNLVKGKEQINCKPTIVQGKTYPLPCIQYKERLWSKGILNQQDIPAIVLGLFETYPNIASAIAKRFPIIILDEAQDTSEEQMQVIDKLISEGTKCYLVGDSDQAIYDWRNASSKSFLDKCSDTTWTSLELSSNFRSSQMICNAISLFSCSQTKMVAEGPEKECTIKPLLILYDNIQISYDDLKVFFKTKCTENELQLSKNNIAVLTRKNHRKEISNLWRSTVCNNFADASIELSLGHRVKAVEKCQKAMFELTIADPLQLNDSEILEKRQQFYSDKKWLDLTGKFFSILPDISLGIQEWLKRLIEQIDSHLVEWSITKRRECDLTLKNMIKTRDNNYPDFKQWPLSNFYNQVSPDNECLESTVHGVKGCTFDATMLVVESTQGTTLTTGLITKGNLNDENMRIAYVAMSRPRKFLCIALPKTKKGIDLSRFPQTIWTTINL
jgi:superfamily I DNA/RNA helicase